MLLAEERWSAEQERIDFENSDQREFASFFFEQNFSIELEKTATTTSIHLMLRLWRFKCKSVYLYKQIHLAVCRRSKCAWSCRYKDVLFVHGKIYLRQIFFIIITLRNLINKHAFHIKFAFYGDNMCAAHTRSHAAMCLLRISQTNNPKTTNICDSNETYCLVFCFVLCTAFFAVLFLNLAAIYTCARRYFDVITLSFSLSVHDNANEHTL